MRQIITFMAVCLVAAQASAGAFEDLVKDTRTTIREEREAAKNQYGADGRLTVEAARRMSQGRSDYDMLVYAYLVASRLDEIDWSERALKAAKQQIELCTDVSANAVLATKQLEAQAREISGDRQTAEALRWQYERAQLDVAARKRYACRGVDQIRTHYKAAAARLAPADPLFDR